ncbi:hypothetical protein [Devosia sp. 1566]|uniref:hypothetical protein n=1 Tax=Devosia sp. 1566 TaxID=2499144 RepID=UPI000FD75F65|nr:hypothetical protein [Devosia sp. 1566]
MADDMEYLAFAAGLVDEFSAQGKRVLPEGTPFLVRGATHSDAGIRMLYDVEPGVLVGGKHGPPAEAVLELLARTYRVRSRRVDRMTWTVPALTDAWWEAAATHFPILRGGGMEFDAGWGDLCIAMADWLAEAAPELEPFRQTKEKFGELRLYYGPGEGLAQQIVDSAELLSTRICEVCGAPGKLGSVRDWYKTTCEAHR